MRTSEAKLSEQALLHIFNDFISEIQYIDDTQAIRLRSRKDSVR